MPNTIHEKIALYLNQFCEEAKFNDAQVDVTFTPYSDDTSVQITVFRNYDEPFERQEFLSNTVTYNLFIKYEKMICELFTQNNAYN